MNNEELSARGRRAEMIVRSPEWVEAWQLFRDRLIDVIENTKADADALEARRMLQAGKAVRDELERMIMDGAVASDDIESAQRAHDLRQLLGGIPR